MLIIIKIISMKHLLQSRSGILWSSVDSPMHNYYWAGEEQNGIFKFWSYSFPVLEEVCIVTGASAVKLMI